VKTNKLFTPDQAAVDRLIESHPFAQLVSVHDGAPVCTPLPLLLERKGDAAWLIGHFARSNPQVSMLRRAPRAVAIFMGPHGYISPSWMRDRTQAPTWNYATVHCDIEVAFDESEQAGHAALERLVAHLEKDRPSAWTTGDMGARYDRLFTAVVAFRARILNTAAKFKLGQNERTDVFDDILGGLRRNGADDLADAMMGFGRQCEEALRDVF
jgi:transcriptional regulator